MPDHKQSCDTPLRHYDIVVYGDEVESILCAVSAARAGAQVALLRRSQHPWLGGLSTRGGLSYMDITPEVTSPLFQEFLDKANVKRVALAPHLASRVLHELCNKAGVTLISTGESVLFDYCNTKPCLSWSAGRVEATVVMDTSPDLDLMRQTNNPYIKGLGGLFGDQHNYLGVSPVFSIAGVPYQKLQAFEASLRSREGLREQLSVAMPLHPEALLDEFITRPTYAPKESDYLDILNPVIGVDYHRWRHKDLSTYSTVPISIDGANVSRYVNESGESVLGFNGLVAQIDCLLGKEGISIDPLIALLEFSQEEVKTPDVLLKEMAFVEQYLQEEAGFALAKVIPPESLYVRQSITMMAKQNVTASEMLLGGVPSEKAIGTFSYWLDLRGISQWEHYPDEVLAKPEFNVGLDCCLPLSPELTNIGMLGRSTGYSPLSQGCGRIVQHNALLAEAMGIASALAIHHNTPLQTTIDTGIDAIRDTMNQRYQAYKKIPLQCAGTAKLDTSAIEQSILLQKDRAITAEHRQQFVESLTVV